MRLIALIAFLVALANPIRAEVERHPYHAFPRDTMYYVEMRLDGGLKPLYQSIATWEDAGAIGLGFANLASFMTDYGFTTKA
ncbi:MAG: hypothetical protein KDB07_09940, partial [Planctomycetes bacterium]|nr:hypothetical protein [Planctomycetota bacterium]